MGSHILKRKGGWRERGEGRSKWTEETKKSK